MNILTSAVPNWVSILFIFTFPISVFLIANIAKEAAIKAELGYKAPLSIYRKIVLFCAFYFIYAALMSYTGLFQVNTLPPLIFLFEVFIIENLG